MNPLPPCVLHEDEHLLVVNKPPGWNTHSPSPYAGEGIYEWLKHREPRWANLAIIHRLDKETSGVLVFGKTPLANKSLTEQFERREVRKRYVLLTDRQPPDKPMTVRSMIVRSGEHYISKNGDNAETNFHPVGDDVRSLTLEILNSKSEIRNQTAPSHDSLCVVIAEPLTGRTHQIRVHAASKGFPILGDTLYGGTPFSRLCLHARELRLRHPCTGEEVAGF
jgi:23S rRNA-/tRNA-specific pseudouridylate synthase